MSRRPRMKSGQRSRCAAHWRPVLAPSMVRREASVWGSVSGPLKPSVARPIRPCCAESTPCVRRRSGNCDAACRRSSVPVTMPRSATRTLPCHIAESHNFSPPASPAIAVSATLSSLARLMDARAGSELASTASSLGVLSAINVYPKRSTLGACVLFCFRIPVWVLGYPRGAHPLTPAPPCAGLVAAPRCTMRRCTAIAESSDCSSHLART